MKEKKDIEGMINVYEGMLSQEGSNESNNLYQNEIKRLQDTKAIITDIENIKEEIEHYKKEIEKLHPDETARRQLYVNELNRLEATLELYDQEDELKR